MIFASSPDLPNDLGSDDNNQMANLNNQVDNDEQQLLRKMNNQSHPVLRESADEVEMANVAAAQDYLHT